VVHVQGSHLDTRYNWFLAYLWDRSEEVVEDSTYVPTETYPRNSSVLHVSGATTTIRIVLLVPPDGAATLADIPSGQPFTYQFGPSTPGNVGIGYAIDVQNASPSLGVAVGPRANLTVRDNGQPLTISMGDDLGDRERDRRAGARRAAQVLLSDRGARPGPRVQLRAQHALARPARRMHVCAFAPDGTCSGPADAMTPIGVLLQPPESQLRAGFVRVGGAYSPVLGRQWGQLGQPLLRDLERVDFQTGPDAIVPLAWGANGVAPEVIPRP
jgi:hypothetical protein